MRLRKKKNLDFKLKQSAWSILECEKGDKNASVPEQRCLDLRAIFGREAPVWLDIGCGKGVFTLALAKRFPSANIVGVERISNVLVVGALKAAEEKIPNLRFLCVGAEYLHRFFRPGSVDMIFLNFSTPFPKPKDENRRLTHRRYIGIFRSLLKSGGELRLKTDDPDFFAFSVESIEACGFESVRFECDSDSPENIVTEHEEFYRRKGKKIYKFVAAKKKEKKKFDRNSSMARGKSRARLRRFQRKAYPGSREREDTRSEKSCT